MGPPNFANKTDRPGRVVTLTLERDVHKFRVVQGESVYQAAGITPFGHDLRKEGKKEEALGKMPRRVAPHPILSFGFTMAGA